VSRSGARTAALVGLCVGFMVVFAALGCWQVKRLGWKRDLIARVEQRLAAAPAPAPGPGAWAGLSADKDGYRRVRLDGVFDHRRETLVQAVTDLGPGFWVMTPLRADQGFTVLVNRGFVPIDRVAQSSRTAGLVQGETRVVGLLRLTEPKGGFLRRNQPEAGRWYSRDVAAIARARGVANVAPYFVDADATANRGGWPRGGLTVVRFANSHLIYALTWFALALFCGGAAVYVLTQGRWDRRKETA
jgi:surfeit locus 1 family protein